MGRFIGGKIGSIISFSPEGTAASAVYDMNDQYYAKRLDGWVPPPVVPVSATGGTTNTPGNGYKYHTFTGSGTFTVTEGAGGTVDVLLVAGGGGAAPGYNSGAGGGGVVHHAAFAVAEQAYTVTIGGGGSSPNYNGSDSTFGGMTADGGGGADSYYGGLAAKSGGSGGGAEGTESNPGGAATQPGLNTPFVPNPSFNQYGNAGGTGTTSGAYSAAGGGGAGGAANPAGPGPGSGSAGGPGQPFSGFEYPIVGLSPVTPQANSPSNNHYGAGGGGWGYSAQNGSVRPTGGGGRGGSGAPGPSQIGVDSVGGGAGNNYYVPSPNKGGDGVCIIRYTT